jgi:hypothetical protein
VRPPIRHVHADACKSDAKRYEQHLESEMRVKVAEGADVVRGVDSSQRRRSSRCTLFLATIMKSPRTKSQDPRAPYQTPVGGPRASCLFGMVANVNRRSLWQRLALHLALPHLRCVLTSRLALRLALHHLQHGIAEKLAPRFGLQHRRGGIAASLQPRLQRWLRVTVKSARCTGAWTIG